MYREEITDTVRAVLAAARGRLREGGGAGVALEAEVLLAHYLGVDRVALYREPDRLLTADQVARYLDLVERRGRGEPVAYLTGHKEFMGLDLTVGPCVLVPRPETELLVETALQLLTPAPAAPLAVDVGTGSGAIAVSLAADHPAVRVLATDVDAAALAVARRNANANAVAERISFFQGDLLAPLTTPAYLEQVDLIAANLPYVPTGELEGLARDVREYEPLLALDGGPDGLDLYRRLVPAARRLLRPGGTLLMEIGPGQGDACLDLVPPPAWESRLLHDLASRERLVVAKKLIPAGV